MPEICVMGQSRDLAFILDENGWNTEQSGSGTRRTLPFGPRCTLERLSRPSAYESAVTG